MIDKVKQAINEASEALREQAAQFGEGAKEKSFQLIEEWLTVFPKLEIYGLQIQSFALSVALSPALEVELVGQHKDFRPERLDKIIQENRKNAALVSVFTAIRTTYNLHRRTLANLNDPLVVKIRVRLSPEIKVYLGKPLIE
ncbi:MAG: hypothetical protein RIC19_19545 [Phaeodactylibacter sp.]|uniref:hypothetical protein n=1 Tax=Phaeodactylibacter sp. TaxID=1940289 RepID=UPI0032EAD4FB